MKKIFLTLISTTLAIFLAINVQDKVFAAKKSSSVQTISVINNEGETIVHGSVLSPKDDEVNIFLTKPLLAKIKKAGLDKLSLNLTSTLDSTKTYTIPSDALSIQRKVINKKPGRYLVISLFNLRTQAGITISPSALPSDSYRIKIVGTQLDTTTEAIRYETPALIVGTSKGSGLVSVENLQGEAISDRTVSTDPNGAFFTEVRANRITSQTKARRYLKAQTAEGGTSTGTTSGSESSNQDTVEEINTCVVHAITDTDLYAIAPLDNDPENNNAKADKPIEVNESTTLTANLAKQNQDLAVEVAKQQLEDLQSEETNTEGDQGVEDTSSEDLNSAGCDVEQFADHCSKDEATLAAVGADFRNFLKAATCSFPEFDLIKKIILASPDSANPFIGKGYCDHVSREVNEDKQCEIYKGILKDYKAGLTKNLICPPDLCSEFKDIRPPKCFVPGGICEQQQGIGAVAGGAPIAAAGCIHKVKDLWCARIGTDIKAEECSQSSDPGYASGGFNPSWTILADSNGNQYCVPSNIPQPTYPPNFVGPKPPSTPQEIVEQCQLNACHRKCQPPQPYTAATSPPSGGNYQQDPSIQCHNECEKASGRFVECNPLSQYFKKAECCGFGPINYAQSTLVYQTVSPPVSPSPTGPYYPPPGGGSNYYGQPYIGPDIQGCLCSDPNNFDSKTGYVKPDSQKTCKDKCPPGFEKDPNGNGCVRSCPGDTVRGPKGNCIKNCPQGFIQDDYGGCRCPEGQYPNPSTGKCEASPCPSYCKQYPVFRKLLEQVSGTGYVPPYTGTGYTPPSSGGYTSPGSTLPPECQRCFSGGGGTCPPGQRKDPATNTCVPNSSCGPNQYADSTGACRCSDGSLATSLGPEGCKNQCPTSTPVKCPDGSCATTQANCSTQCPPPYEKNPSGSPPCKCPDATPFDYRGTCVATCPAGLIGDYPQYSSGPASSMRFCLCPDKSYPDQNGKCNSTSCPPATPIRCPNGSCVVSSSSCTSTTNHVCVGSEVPTATNPCTCAVGATPSGPGGSCQCTNGRAYTGLTTCDTQTNYCAAGISTSIGCTCAPPGYTGSDGKCTCPPGYSTAYSSLGCGGSSSNYCSPGIVPTSANPCTCNPSGGSYFNSSNTCTCPTNSGSYTKETGCASTSRACNAGEGPSNNCYCFGGGFNGSDGKCQCSGGIQYTGAGCGSSTTSHVCAPGEAATTSNPCYCAGGATFSGTGGTGTCQCTGGQAYTVSGCGRPCTAGEGPSNGCYCFGTGFTGSDGKCQCSGGVQYTGGGCGSSTTSHVCAAGEAATTSNPCYCAGGATFSGTGGTGTCQCPNNNNPPYTIAGCGSTTSCPSSTPIRCSDGSCATTQASCPCTGSTPIRCSDNTCAATQASCPSSSCPSPYVVNPSGTPPCTCPAATPISYNATCVASCPSPFVVQTPSGGMPWCTCPTGQMQGSDPSTCVACPACTGGKIFSGPGCACSCPQGKTDVNGVCQ